MDENILDRRIMEFKPQGAKSRGRPKLVWMNGVGEELSKWIVARGRE
jgi:hypothetical protein